MELNSFKSCAGTSKINNQDRAPLKRTYSLKTKRPIYISKVLSKVSVPLNITVPSAPKTVSFSQSFVEITPKARTSFLLFTPKKYDLGSKKLTSELEASVKLLNLGVSCEKEVRKVFDDDFCGALSKIHQESVEYEKLSFVEPYSHPKSRKFLKAVKTNDLVQVAQLLSDNPALITTTDAVPST